MYIYIYVCLYLYYIDIYVHNIYVYTYYLYLNIDQWFHTIRSILSPLKWVWYYLVFDLFPPQVTECSWMPINWPVSSLEWCHRWWMEPESTNMPKTSRVDLTYMHWKLNMVPGKWWFGNWTCLILSMQWWRVRLVIVISILMLAEMFAATFSLSNMVSKPYNTSTTLLESNKYPHSRYV